MADDLYYVGVQPTVLDFEGSQVVIGPNTVVHRDSAIRAAFPSLFGPLIVHFDAAPPKETKAEKAAAKAEEKAEEKKPEPKRVEPPIEKRTTHTR
jgi:hypothetical protein